MFEQLNQKVCDLNFTEKQYPESETISYHSIIDGIGTISILDRMTGFSFYGRDIETGFKDINGTFWLASFQRFDIRDYPDMNVIKAIHEIKKRSNTCKRLLAKWR